MNRYKVGFVWQEIYMDEVLAHTVEDAACKWVRTRKRDELTYSRKFVVYVRQEKKLFEVIVDADVTVLILPKGTYEIP